jgi:hypothetical protein
MKHQPMGKKTALALFTLFDLMAIVGIRIEPKPRNSRHAGSSSA